MIAHGGMEVMHMTHFLERRIADFCVLSRRILKKPKLAADGKSILSSLVVQYIVTINTLQQPSS